MCHHRCLQLMLTSLFLSHSIPSKVNDECMFWPSTAQWKKPHTSTSIPCLRRSHSDIEGRGFLIPPLHSQTDQPLSRLHSYIWCYLSTFSSSFEWKSTTPLNFITSFTFTIFIYYLSTFSSKLFSFYASFDNCLLQFILNLLCTGKPILLACSL